MVNYVAGTLVEDFTWVNLPVPTEPPPMLVPESLVGVAASKITRGWVPFTFVTELHDWGPPATGGLIPSTIRTVHAQPVVVTTYPPIYQTSEGGSTGPSGPRTPRVYPPIYLHDELSEKEYASPWAYKVFRSDGVWNWEAAGKPEFVDVLVVAGGGGGGGSFLHNEVSAGRGGGGAGGVVFAQSITVTADVGVLVGEGGHGYRAGSVERLPTNGGDSSFGDIIATGGGFGGGAYTGRVEGKPGDGGSGGGSGHRTYAEGGHAIVGQGSNGGGGVGPTAEWGSAGAGGGGAGGIGQSLVNQRDPNLGKGGGTGRGLAEYGFTEAALHGAPLRFAGGGGGGACSSCDGAGYTGVGVDGGGQGGLPGAHSLGGDGLSGTGGGGGGRGGTNIGRGAEAGSGGGNGGSGIVIVRWLKPRSND